MNKALPVIVFVMLISGCGSAPEAPEPQPVLVPVFYGTDRVATGTEDFDDAYGADRGPLSFGMADVSMPPDHRVGQIEEPSLISLEFSAEADSHVVLQHLAATPQPAFLAALQQRVRETGNDSVFIFVHGYNVSFAEAMRRTAQIADDLEWRGTSVLYSWASHAEIDGYDADHENALAAVADLSEFIETVAVYSGAARVHVIAHSMGSEPLLAALVRHAESTSATGVPLVDEVVLAAPDVAADEFTALVARAKPAARHFTLYVSGKDDALALSSLLNAKPRAGDSTDGVLVLPGVDTIDASTAEADSIGHSYYGESRAILADMFSLLKTGMAPDQRFGLHPAEADGKKYWILRP
jgi:esterase/lipase superfamily enzyme